MTRGTVLFVGKMDRESELLVSRLKRDAFTVDHCATERQLGVWCRTNTAQAVLFTRLTPPFVIKRALAAIRYYKRMQHIPAVLVADTTVAPEQTAIKGLGEVFYLHRITVAEAVRRLLLAIQLTQLARRT